MNNFPDSVKNLFKRIKKRSGIGGDIVLLSKEVSKYFGYYYIGFWDKRKKSKKSTEQFNQYVSEAGSTFFEGRITDYGEYYIKPYIVPLDDGYFYLVTIKRKRESGQIPGTSDSVLLHENSFREMMTLKTGKAFKPYAGVLKGIDSALHIIENERYLTALHKIQQMKSGFYSEQDSSAYWQLLMTSYSFLDEIDTIRNLLDSNKAAKAPPLLKQSNSESHSLETRVKDALSEVYRVAQDREILMINESHYDWRHRYFVSLLLDSLYKIGYRYLALETLSYDRDLPVRGFPIVESGFYVREPFMAELIRKALRKGFSLIPYEDTSATDEGKFTSLMDKREYLQAKNLFEQFKKNKNGKWLVLAGYGHINKLKLTHAGGSSMAMYFKKMSHVDPFCIDQPRYCDLLTESTAVQKLSTGYYSLNANQIDDEILSKQCDLYIINSIKEQPYETGALHNPQYQQFEISLRNNVIREKVNQSVLMVFYTKELKSRNEKDCIPVYIKRVTGSKQTMLNIALPDDEYTVVVKDDMGNILESREINR
ncbi:MAG: hypothetical protein QM763_19235 [Agriterribacter sp.]